MRSAFERQLTVMPPRIFGRRLAVLRVGHVHLLELAKSPFVGASGSSVCDMQDVILVAYLLRFRTYSAAKRVCGRILSGRIPRGIRILGKRYGAGFDPQETATALTSYILEATTPPRALHNPDSKRLATPPAWTLATLHMHYFGTSRAHAMEMPFLEAITDVFTLRGALAMMELVGEDRAAFLDRVAALKAKRKIEAAAKAKGSI